MESIYLVSQNTFSYFHSLIFVHQRLNSVLQTKLKKSSTMFLGYLLLFFMISTSWAQDFFITSSLPVLVQWTNSLGKQQNLVFSETTLQKQLKTLLTAEFPADFTIDQLIHKFVPSPSKVHIYQLAEIIYATTISYTWIEESARFISSGQLKSIERKRKFNNKDQRTSEEKNNAEIMNLRLSDTVQHNTSSMAYTVSLIKDNEDQDLYNYCYVLVDTKTAVISVKQSLVRMEPSCLTLSPMSNKLLAESNCETLKAIEIYEKGNYKGLFEEYLLSQTDKQLTIEVHDFKTINQAVHLNHEVLDIPQNSKILIEKVHKPTDGQLLISVQKIKSGGNSIRIVLKNPTNKFIFTQLSCLSQDQDFCKNQNVLMSPMMTKELKFIAHSLGSEIVVSVDGMNSSISLKLEKIQIQSTIAEDFIYQPKINLKRNLKLPKRIVVVLAVTGIVLGIGSLVGLIVFFKKKRIAGNSSSKQKKELNSMTDNSSDISHSAIDDKLDDKENSTSVDLGQRSNDLSKKRCRRHAKTQSFEELSKLQTPSNASYSTIKCQNQRFLSSMAKANSQAKTQSSISFHSLPKLEMNQRVEKRNDEFGDSFRIKDNHAGLIKQIQMQKLGCNTLNELKFHPRLAQSQILDESSMIQEPSKFFTELENRMKPSDVFTLGDDQQMSSFSSQEQERQKNNDKLDKSKRRRNDINHLKQRTGKFNNASSAKQGQIQINQVNTKQNSFKSLSQQKSQQKYLKRVSKATKTRDL